MDKAAHDFNSLSPKTNKVSAAWNKAVESYNGGRGPSASKFQTLTKRYETTLSRYQKIEIEVAEKQSAFKAIKQRLAALSFGLFGGNLKRAKNDLLELAKEHQLKTGKLLTAIGSLREEVARELETEQKKL